MTTKKRMKSARAWIGAVVVTAVVALGFASLVLIPIISLVVSAWDAGRVNVNLLVAGLVLLVLSTLIFAGVGIGRFVYRKKPVSLMTVNEWALDQTQGIARDMAAMTGGARRSDD